MYLRIRIYRYWCLMKLPPKTPWYRETTSYFISAKGGWHDRICFVMHCKIRLHKVILDLSPKWCEMLCKWNIYRIFPGGDDKSEKGFKPSIYIYIYIERERDGKIYIYIYMHAYTNITICHYTDSWEKNKFQTTYLMELYTNHNYIYTHTHTA